jgi:hypothetical protein
VHARLDEVEEHVRRRDHSGKELRSEE